MNENKPEKMGAAFSSYTDLRAVAQYAASDAMAASTGDKSIDNEVHYQVNGAIDAGVRYWSMEYDEVDTDGSILLNGSKFADRSNQWGLSNTEPYAGRFCLISTELSFMSRFKVFPS